MGKQTHSETVTKFYSKPRYFIYQLQFKPDKDRTFPVTYVQPNILPCLFQTVNIQMDICGASISIHTSNLHLVKDLIL